MMNVLALGALLFSGAYAQSTNVDGNSGFHPELARWCGKPYMAGSPNFAPGGDLQQPKLSGSPLLLLQVAPRHSIYVGSETTGSFVVNAGLSQLSGQQYWTPTNSTSPATLDIMIMVEGACEFLVSDKVTVNTTGNLFDFPISALKPQFDAYNITLTATSSDGLYSYTATTELFYLPEKTTGSVTKIDNLNGGLLFRNSKSNGTFKPLLPYGFYTDYGGYLDLSLDNVQAYADQGYNTIHPVPSFSDNLTVILDFMDEIDLAWHYDMRNDWFNDSSVTSQVNMVKDHDGLFAYYTGDEPDGWEYNLTLTKTAYDLITSLDKYHPVALVLNCQNFFFEDYTAGADIIFEDAYPVGINATFSGPFGTVCNSTYGDCGCDNCIGNLTDVSDRLDDLSNYMLWLAQYPKPLYAVMQAFIDNYWSRYPTVQETWVMVSIAFNHGAKGIIPWIFPVVDQLENAHSQMAKVVTVSPVVDFLLGGQPTAITVEQQLDIAFWTVGGQTFVNIANLNYQDVSDEVSIPVPNGVSTIVSQPWGNVTWTISGGMLKSNGLAALSTSMVILH